MVILDIRSPIMVEDASSPLNGNSLSVVEAAYDLESDDVTWLRVLLRKIEPLIGRGLGVLANRYRVASDGSRLEIDALLFLDCKPRLHEFLVRGTEALDGRYTVATYMSLPCQSMSQSFQRAGLPYADSDHARAMRSDLGIGDILIVNCWEAEGRGCSFGAPVARPQRFPTRTAGTLSRVARHISAAQRLRRAVHREQGRTSIDADAVITESGAVVHAEGEAKGRAERALLAETARVLVDAKHRLRDDEPEQVLEIWNALVDGRWSLVHSVDRDGKRFLLARRNALDVPEPTALSGMERQVAALFARGHAAKLIAYELGISNSSVSDHLHRAIRKLGVRSRAELTAIFRPRAAGSGPAPRD